MFQGISADEVTILLSCLKVRTQHYKKGETVIREGDPVDSLGLVLFGFVQVIRLDYEGNRLIQAGFGPGAVFAESIVAAGISRSPVSVVCGEDSAVLFIPFEKMFKSCASSCSFHHKLIVNVVEMLARKNLLLSSRIEVASKRSIREKILEYLGQEKKRQGGEEILIPYNQTELADFLCVDRSALSRELGNMKAQGLIAANGRRFRLFR